VWQNNMPGSFILSGNYSLFQSLSARRKLSAGSCAAMQEHIFALRRLALHSSIALNRWEHFFFS
ncbi:hypothetical protein, partial [Planococcus sp. CAU13]|uniref:hypothetical protein n=1 Tax=Planococcus sp. CAU13 TaxID=1541197 RepID=UPI001F465B5C